MKNKIILCQSCLTVLNGCHAESKPNYCGDGNYYCDCCIDQANEDFEFEQEIKEIK